MEISPFQGVDISNATTIRGLHPTQLWHNWPISQRTEAVVAWISQIPVLAGDRLFERTYAGKEEEDEMYIRASLSLEDFLNLLKPERNVARKT